MHVPTAAIAVVCGHFMKHSSISCIHVRIGKCTVYTKYYMHLPSVKCIFAI